MDLHVKEFYRQFSDEFPEGKFHRAIALHDAPDVDWSELHDQFPVVCKGWYELTLLSTADRIEFTRDYWLSKLPYTPRLDQFIMRFFDSLDDVGIYVYQRQFDDPFEVDVVYSLKNNNGFFRGSSAASDAQIEELKAQFSDCIFPADYLAFTQIHSGFCKTTDCTGMIKIQHLHSSYQRFQELFTHLDEPLRTSNGIAVDAKKLIPFYESFGMPFYQCFWMEWYPDQEMGNVYYSGNSSTISDIGLKESGAETLAFPTFIDWLMFYLERID